MTTAAMDPVANGSPTTRATVGIGMAGTPLPVQVNSRLLRVVVDNDLHLPGMFELTFLDLDGQTLSMAGIAIGTQVRVTGAPAASAPTAAPRAAAGPLIMGEVTAIEGLMQGMTSRTIVRGYTMVHRLQRARKSKVFLNSTDSDIARQIVTLAGLMPGVIVATRTTHAHMPQVNQTDWEFLTERATEIGYELGVENGRFFFRPSGPQPGGRGLAGAVGRAVAGAARAAGGGGAAVKFPDTLISFRPRITAGNLTPNVEVRVWDPMRRVAIAQVATTPTGPSPSPNSLGGQFAGGRLAGAIGGALGAAASGNLGAAAAGASGALSSMTGGLIGSPIGYLGPPPNPTAHVVSDRPLANALTMPTAGPTAAAALGSDLGSTYAEAEGDAVGNPGIQPGATVTVSGVPAPFAGSWKVSRARHVFDDSEHGYRTTFAAHGRQDRSMLGLTSRSAPASSGRATIDGVVCGVVSNAGDPLGKSRVKVTLPWLSPTFETDWAPTVQFCAGQRTGAMFLPEVGDQVLVAFEFGDPRRPYVLGGMVNNHSKWDVTKYPITAGPVGDIAAVADSAAEVGAAGAKVAGSAGSAAAGAAGGGALGSAVMSPGMISEVRHRGFVSSTGNCLMFHDHPLPLPLPTAGGMPGAAPAGGSAVGGSAAAPPGGATASPAGAASSLLGPGFGALASGVRLGTQDGRVGLSVDQVNGGVDLICKPTIGVSRVPLGTVTISASGVIILDAPMVVYTGQLVVAPPAVKAAIAAADAAAAASIAAANAATAAANAAASTMGAAGGLMGGVGGGMGGGPLGGPGSPSGGFGGGGSGGSPGGSGGGGSGGGGSGMPGTDRTNPSGGTTPSGPTGG